MSEENLNEPLTEEQFADMFDADDEEMVTKPKSPLLKTVALLIVAALLAGSIGFLLVRVLSSKNSAPEVAEEADLGGAPTFYFSEESRWFCVNGNTIVGCETPHVAERHYYHFANPHGVIDASVVEQASAQQITPEEFCVAWFSANATNLEKLLDPNQTSIGSEVSPGGIFCDLDFREPQTGPAVTFSASTVDTPAS